MVDVLTEAEFRDRFVERMLARTGGVDGNGDSVIDYAKEAALGYWEDDDMREEGPEECADADLSYWED